MNFKLTDVTSGYCIYITNCIYKNALTEKKPPPIRRIRISDFGLPDPKRDPDCHQNCYHLVLEPCATPPKNFVKIRSQVCE